jgi:hypothetical protein
LDTRHIQSGSPTRLRLLHVLRREGQNKSARSAPTEKRRSCALLRFHATRYYIHSSSLLTTTYRVDVLFVKNQLVRFAVGQISLKPTKRKKFLPAELTSSCCILESGLAELAYPVPLDAAGGGPDEVAPPPPRSGLAIRPKFNDVALAFFCASNGIDHCQALTRQPVRQLTSGLF